MKSNFPSHWNQEKLDDVIDALIDYRGKTPRKTSSGVPLVTAKIVKEGNILEPKEFIAPDEYDSWMRRGIPNVGDVVLTVEAPLGEVAQLNDKNIALAQRIVTLRGKDGILDNTYLKYFLMSPFGQNELKSRESGSTVKGIKQSELRKINVIVPPICEQKNIGEVLHFLDEKIRNNQKMNLTLEKIAQRIFKSWFIDFDPVRANAEGIRFDGLSPEIQSLFPSEFVESEMGLIPKGWENKDISEVFSFNPKYKITKGQEAPFIEMKALPTSGMSVDYVLDKNFTSGSKFKNNDTLVARITPCLENGKTAYVNLLREDAIGWGSGEFIVISPKNIEQSEFIYCLARTGSFRAFSVSKMTGTSGRQRVSFQDMGSFQIAYPEGEGVVKAFSNICRPLFEKIAENSKQNEVLNSLRDRLLPKLLSGAIEIKDVEEQMAKAS